MESLNMNTLVKTLPSSAVKAEKDLGDKFKAAALSLTTLYRSSQQSSKRHFDAGYLAALDDLLAVIQHGVSASHDSNANSGSAYEEGMSIGRIMDWIEARQEAISVKEKDDEEEEREREGRMAGSTSGGRGERDKTGSTAQSTPSKQSGLASRHMDSRSHPEPVSSATRTVRASSSISPPPTPAVTAVSTPATSSLSPTCSQTCTRPRSQHARDAPVPPPPHLNPITNNSNPELPSNLLAGRSNFSVTSIIGAKRRHAAVLLDAYAPATASVSFPSVESLPTPSGAVFDGRLGATATRRRVKNSRVSGGSALGMTCTENTSVIDMTDTMMDVEDERGRERKRVARR